MSMADDDPEALPRVAAFESGLRELGWLDGRNLRIEYRWVSDGDLLRRNAAELARMPPDLILATSTPVMAALREPLSLLCRERRSPVLWQRTDRRVSARGRGC
jgi:putative tryptophan/tyrosine transport system substrate-binding protein